MFRFMVASDSVLTSTELPSSPTETPLDTLASRRERAAKLGVRAVPGRGSAKPTLRVVTTRGASKIEDAVTGFNFAAAGKYQPQRDKFVAHVIGRALVPPGAFMTIAAFFTENPQYSTSRSIFSGLLRTLPTFPVTVRSVGHAQPRRALTCLFYLKHAMHTALTAAFCARQRRVERPGSERAGNGLGAQSEERARQPDAVCCHRAGVTQLRWFC
jgi:hypothetical protein